MVTAIQHAFIGDIIYEIIEIKSLSWDYLPEQHMAWIQQNLNKNDWHCLMYDGDQLIGYSNLVHVNVDKGDKKIPFLGVGNVCTRYKGRGDGLKLMNNVNTFLTSSQSNGLLFCKENLVKFYEKANWRVIRNLHSSKEVFTMIYGSLEESEDLTYNDRNF